MTQPLTDDRQFTPARQAQGFTSQAQLDAFYAQYDHTRTCPDCQALNGYALLSDGWQPTQGECSTAKRLLSVYFSF